MKAYTYVKPGLASFVDVDKPVIRKPTDAIVRIVKTTICGTDLHIIKGDVPACKSGTILGHEGIGIVEEVGAGVSNFKKGDKVLISCVCACGKCYYCKKGIYAHCEDEGGWIFGHLIDGMQAEYLRVPHADNTLYHTPADLSDEALVMLSDILPTGYEIGVLKGKVEELLTKAEELVNQVNEEGVKASLSDEVKNLKVALEKEDADLDELNTQVQDLLKRISLTIQNERDNSKQDPEVLALYQKLYNGVIALHTYLEMNNGSDADFEKVDALFDKLSAASKDKQALLTVAQEIVSLNQELRSKATPSQETPVETKQATPGQASTDEQVEASSVQTTTENTSETTEKVAD